MSVDGAYALTRRRGKSGTVSRLTNSSANPKTGLKSDTVVATTVRWLFKQQTQFSRLYRASMTQQNVGDTTFVMWLPDVESVFSTLFTELRPEDTITYEGSTYSVVSSSIEDNALIVTAREFQ